MGLKEFQAVVKQIQAANPTWSYAQVMAEAKKRGGTVEKPTTSIDLDNKGVDGLKGI